MTSYVSKPAQPALCCVTPSISQASIAFQNVWLVTGAESLPQLLTDVPKGLGLQEATTRILGAVMQVRAAGLHGLPCQHRTRALLALTPWPLHASCILCILFPACG